MANNTSNSNIEALQSASDIEAAVHATAGQRKINLLWEVTQCIIAISVTLATLGICVMLVINDTVSQSAFNLLSNVFFLVVGTYFQRTNHTKTGGITPRGDR